MPEGISNNQGDFIDWEKIRESKEYKKYLLQNLRIRLANFLFPDLEKRKDKAYGHITEENFPDIGEFASAVDAADPTTPGEDIIIGKIYQLKNPEEFKGFCESRNINFDVDKNVQEIEKSYPKDMKLLETVFGNGKKEKPN